MPKDVAFIPGAGYIKRSESKLFANVGTDEAPEWELQGDRNEELTHELNPNVESGEDVTGQTYADLDKYEEETAVETYRAKRDSKWAVVLYNIIKYRKTLTDVVHQFLIVNTFAGADGAYDAWLQKGVVAVQSHAGDTKGMNMPYNIHWTGERIHGTFDLETLTFTPSDDTADAPKEQSASGAAKTTASTAKA